MILLPYIWLKPVLEKREAYIKFKQYEKSVCKIENNRLRTKFLNDCKKSDIVPKFLKFRIPNNGAFNEKSVHEFQIKLLSQEIVKSKGDKKELEKRLDECRHNLKTQFEVENMSYLLPSIISI